MNLANYNNLPIFTISVELSMIQEGFLVCITHNLTLYIAKAQYDFLFMVMISAMYKLGKYSQRKGLRGFRNQGKAEVSKPGRPKGMVPN